MIETLVTPRTVELLAQTLLHFLWQGAAIALLAVVGMRTPGLHRAAGRYGVCLILFTTMSLLPAATLVWLDATTPASSFAAAPSESTGTVMLPQSTVIANPSPANAMVARAALGETVAPMSRLSASVRESGSILASGGVSPGTSTSGAWARLAPWCAAAWLAGVALMSLRLLVGGITVVTLRRGRTPLPAGLQAFAMRTSRALGMAATPVVAASSRAVEAMAVGLIRPAVLIPAAWLLELPVEMLEAVIAHELAHIRRRDLWVNGFQRLVETLLFYHPAVWWLSGRLREERELCCDLLAVRLTRRPDVYAQTLATVAGRRPVGRVPILASGMGEPKMKLLNRVRHVLGTAGERSPGWLPSLATIAIILCGLALYRMTLVTTPHLRADEERERPEFRDSDRDDHPRGDRERDGARDGDHGLRRNDDFSGGGDRRPPHDEDRPHPEVRGMDPHVAEMIRHLHQEIESLRRQLAEERERNAMHLRNPLRSEWRDRPVREAPRWEDERSPLDRRQDEEAGRERSEPRPRFDDFGNRGEGAGPGRGPAGPPRRDGDPLVGPPPERDRFPEMRHDEGPRRDGDRPADERGPREGDRRDEEHRDGEDRDGGKRRDGGEDRGRDPVSQPRPGEREGFRPPVEGELRLFDRVREAELQELRMMIHKLAETVEQLQKQIEESSRPRREGASSRQPAPYYPGDAKPVTPRGAAVLVPDGGTVLIPESLEPAAAPGQEPPTVEPPVSTFPDATPPPAADAPVTEAPVTNAPAADGSSAVPPPSGDAAGSADKAPSKFKPI